MSSSFTPEEHKRAEEIKQALGASSAPTNQSEPVLQRRTDWTAIGFGLAAAALVAVGFIVVLRRPAAEPETPVAAVTNPPPPVSTPATPQPMSAPPSSQKVVQVLVPQPVAQPAARPSPTPAKRPAPVTTAPVRPLVQSPAPAQRSVDPSAEHERVARDYAQNHFRYKYQLGSGYVAINSVNIEVDDCSEVPMWNRYRTTGEVGIEYFDSPGRVFNRTTRKFEVLTEERNGRIRAFEITVK